MSSRLPAACSRRRRRQDFRRPAPVADVVKTSGGMFPNVADVVKTSDGLPPSQTSSRLPTACPRSGCRQDFRRRSRTARSGCRGIGKDFRRVPPRMLGYPGIKPCRDIFPERTDESLLSAPGFVRCIPDRRSRFGRVPPILERGRTLGLVVGIRPFRDIDSVRGGSPSWRQAGPTLVSAQSRGSECGPASGNRRRKRAGIGNRYEFAVLGIYRGIWDRTNLPRDPGSSSPNGPMRHPDRIRAQVVVGSPARSMSPSINCTLPAGGGCVAKRLPCRPPSRMSSRLPTGRRRNGDARTLDEGVASGYAEATRSGCRQDFRRGDVEW